MRGKEGWPGMSDGDTDQRQAAGAHHVGEARVEYLVYPQDDELEVRVTTRLSSKNQITLPVAMVRRLGLRSGDEIDLMVDGDMIQAEKRPKTPQEWIERLRGALAGTPEWKNKDSIDAWIRGERESWGREWDRDEQPS